MQSQTSFFWEQKSHLKGRARFNLLHLEHGEYFLEDFMVLRYPFPDEFQSFHQCDSLKVQGRLKLCSRSVIFEPSDSGKPIVKYMFKSFRSQLVEYRLSKTDSKLYGTDVSGFFSFRTNNVIELMENSKIGPYKSIDYEDRRNGVPVLFSLIHTELSYVLSKIDTLYNVFSLIERDGDIGQLRSIISSAATNTFDTSHLVDFHENFLINKSIQVKRIKPLIVTFGCLMVTDKHLYFQPAQLNNVSESVQHFEFAKISRLYRRRYLLRHSSFEIIMKDGSSAFFSFDFQTDCENVFDLILSMVEPSSVSSTDKVHASVSSRKLAYDHAALEEALRKWQQKEMTNFEYLMFLNNEADRSMNDLTQYPVFPHVIADYKSQTLDLKSSKTFRDLSKPIGALNPVRLAHLKERYRSMPDEDPELGIPPPFLYGTHYSTPGYVLHFLVRVAPEYMLCLQNGKFDTTDRMFISIADSWDSCLNNPADLKELIPEFFVGNGDFLNNLDDLDLGHRHTGERLNDVDLPMWAKSPRDYIRKHSKALESDYVSSQIHHWIDLIFGYKQRGKEAQDADNVFYYLTYEGAVDIEKETDPRRRHALEMQIQEFGQTPKQLFLGPHPPRSGSNDSHVRTCFAGNSTESYASTRVDSPQLPENTKSRQSAPPPLLTGSGGASSRVSSPPAGGKPAELGKVNISHDDPDSTSIQLLGEDFKEEVSRQIKKESLGMSTSSLLSALSDQTALLLDRTFGSPQKTAAAEPSQSVPLPMPPQSQSVLASSTQSSYQPPTNSVSAQNRIMSSMPRSSRLQAPLEVRAVSLQPVSESFPAHREGLTGITVAASHRATVCTCSRDATMKVLHFDSSPVTGGNVRIAARRSFSPSDPNPISACCVSKDGKVAYVSCFDNLIYSYSIPNACLLGKIVAHDDSVSSLSLDGSCRWLVSGSWDATVKLWPTRVSDGTVHLPACLEMFDHEAPVSCVSIDDEAGLVAAGAEDGTVVVWTINPARKSSTQLFSKLLTSAKRQVTCVKWTPSFFGPASPSAAARRLLVCGTADGVVTSVDSSGRVVSAIRLTSISRESARPSAVGVRCIDLDGELIFGGCDDGSLRVWKAHDDQPGTLVEMCVQVVAHPQGVGAICVNSEDGTLISGGDEGRIRVWKIELL